MLRRGDVEARHLEATDTRGLEGEYNRAPVLDHNVQFTLYRPRAIRTHEWEPLLVFAHLSERRSDAKEDDPDPVREVERQALAILGPGTHSRQAVDSTRSVPRQGEVT